jgi:hypothetical protein
MANGVPSLESVETRWIELFDELFHIDGAQIAAPFFSVPATQARSILYVGKATAKDWNRVDFCSQPPFENMKERREQRRECTKNFLIEHAPRYNSGFWHFAKELNAEAAKKWNQRVTSAFQHITWTNICKIGALKGNPRGFLMEKQRDIAVETLRLEIELYKPQLICFVTWDYAFDLVKKVIGDPNDASWDQTESEEWIWWRKATGKLPAIVLSGHPERKSTKTRERWLKRVWSLLPD